VERIRISLEEVIALSSERRLLILALISDGLRTRRALIGKLDITGPSLSRHIDVLKRTGLVTVSKERNSNLRVQNRYTLTERGESLLDHIDFGNPIRRIDAREGVSFQRRSPRSVPEGVTHGT